MDYLIKENKINLNITGSDQPLKGDRMEQEFKNVEYVKLGENGKMHVCCVTLPNSFSAIGSYVQKKDQDEEDAQQMSYQMAIKNLNYANEKRNRRKDY